MNDIFAELGTLFGKTDRTLFLVGGSVRDKVLGRNPKDLDFTTDAMPWEIKKLLSPWADAVWDIGEKFGTIAARKGGIDVEITTFRNDGPGRKPKVQFTDSLEEDLKRRDFTMNAMAMKVDSLGLIDSFDEIIDPFGGVKSLQQGFIDTPRAAEESFNDDPLRMLRAARFSSQLNMPVVSRVRMAMMGLRHRIDEVSKERIVAELDKTLAAQTPEHGLALLAQTAILNRVLPELRWEWPILVLGDVETRWADLLRKVPPGDVEIRMRQLKCSTDRVRNVTDLVAATQRFEGKTEWSDADIRQALVVSTEDNFLRLVKLLRASDTLLPRATALVAREGMPTPPLTGKEIMLATGMKPGPKVGAAMQLLWKLRLEKGPVTLAEAVAAISAL